MREPWDRDFFGCLTGDCPHSTAIECVGALGEFTGELWEDLRLQENKSDRLKTDLAAAIKSLARCSRYLEEHRSDTPLSGHFDTVDGKLADSIRSELKRLRKSLREI